MPVLIFGLAAILGYAAGRITRTDPYPPQPTPRQLPAPAVKTSGRVMQVQRRLPPPKPEISYIEELEACLEARSSIPRKLVQLAMEEAYDEGDVDTARAISILFSKAKKKGEKKAEDDKTSAEEPQAESDMAEESPIEHVASDAWKDFVSKLRVREPSYQTDRHIGCFEHNRQRLKTLGIADPKTEDDQYKALVADLKDHYEHARPLIDEFSGDAVKLKGTEHPITMSGILALLKSGGVQGAEQWLRDPAAREKYPRTEELFLKANGCF